MFTLFLLDGDRVKCGGLVLHHTHWLIACVALQPESSAFIFPAWHANLSVRYDSDPGKILPIFSHVQKLFLIRVSALISALSFNNNNNNNDARNSCRYVTCCV
jgi:hypothetical protein